MSPTPRDIADLTPEEKRALLVELLKKRATESGSQPQPAQERSGGLNQLAINVRELNREAVLDPTVSVEAVASRTVTEPADIFLTGATGFLGAFLLHELLQKTTADIHCLVRCSSVEDGMARIERNLESYVPGNGLGSARIIPVPGDLSKPLLGLSTQQFRTLAEKIDCIYHSAAWVNWIYPYDRLKPTNVLGTQEVLRLACRVGVKPVHFVSSISVFPLFSDAGAPVIYEGDSLDHGSVLYGGYMQSKWVAEKLVMIARSRGLPVAIYRPGLIAGHSQTGVWNTEDVTSKLIKSFVELGYAPDLDAATDMTPVDYVSRAIVHLSTSRGSLGGVFHLANPQPVHARDLVTWMRSFGYPIEPVSYERWRAQLVERAKLSRDNASHSLAPLFSITLADDARRFGAHQPDTSDGLGIIFLSHYAKMSVRFDCQNALDGLSNTSIACPMVDGKLFDTYLSYFVRSGFLNAPPPGDLIGGVSNDLGAAHDSC